MEGLLTIEQAAALLGIKESTLYDWTSRGKIPHVKLSRRCIRFIKSELEAWLKAKAVFPTDTSEVPHRKPYVTIRVRKAACDTNVDRMVKRVKEEVLHGSRIQ